MELTYSRYREDFILDALGLELDEAGHFADLRSAIRRVAPLRVEVVFQDGGCVGTVCGKKSQRIDRVGSYVHDEEEETLIVCDHISCITSYLMDEEEWDDPRE